MEEIARVVRTEQLKSTTPGASGASWIGVSPVQGADVVSVQDALAVLAARTDPGEDPYAELGRVAGQPITNDTWTPVEWTSEAADPYNWHNATLPERITPGAGRYLVSFYTPWAANTTGIRRRGVSTTAAAGLDENFTNPTANANAPATHSYVMRCGAKDYITCYVRQNSGGGLGLLAGVRLKIVRL